MTEGRWVVHVILGMLLAAIASACIVGCGDDDRDREVQVWVPAYAPPPVVQLEHTPTQVTALDAGVADGGGG